MKFFLITIVTLALVGCGGGGGYKHVKFAKATAGVIKLSELAKLDKVFKEHEIMFAETLGTTIEDKRIVIKIQFEKTKATHPFNTMPLIGKCKNGYPKLEDDMQIRDMEVKEEKALEFKNDKDFYVSYLFFTEEQFLDRKLITEDGIIADNICFFPGINITRKNMVEDDITAISKKDMQEVYLEYVRLQE